MSKEPWGDAETLKWYQDLPLEQKILHSQQRIREWDHKFFGEVYVSFSGGKDSTALLHLVRETLDGGYHDEPVKGVFCDTGLEYPEIREFARSIPNVELIRPKMRFDQVISTYGYPLIGKEVAEAIYYARRIRSQTVNVERERAGQRK